MGERLVNGAWNFDVTPEVDLFPGEMTVEGVDQIPVEIEEEVK